MSKVAIVYWSGTGNTQIMANAVVEGAKSAGAETSVFGASELTSDMIAGFDGIAFGCPAMGAEVLEETEFEPMFSAVEGFLSGKKVGLFGSYGWGDGQWMRDWEDRCNSNGAMLVAEGVMANYAPGEAELESCRSLGTALAR